MQQIADKYWFDYPIVSCTIDVTERCNLACKYCFTWNKTDRDLSLDMAKKIVKFFFEHCDKQSFQPYQISFWGGEPLLKFDTIVYLVEYIERVYSNFNVVFGGTTNGILLDKEKAKWLKEHRAKFVVSLDGCKEVHDYYRVFPDGSGSFDIIMDNLYAIKGEWPDVHLRFSLSKKLIPCLYDSIVSLYKEGFQFFSFSPVFEEKWEQEDWIVLEEQLNLLVDFIKSHSDIFIKHLMDAGSGIWQDYPCGAGRSYVGFSVDGTIFPCHRFNKYGEENAELRRKYNIGHVSYGFNEKRQVFLDYPIIRKKQCFGCEVYPYCAGGCYAVHQDIVGSIFGKFDMFCRYHKLLFSVAENLGSVKDEYAFYNPFLNANFSCKCFNMFYS